MRQDLRVWATVSVLWEPSLPDAAAGSLQPAGPEVPPSQLQRQHQFVPLLFKD